MLWRTVAGEAIAYKIPQGIPLLSTRALVNLVVGSAGELLQVFDD